MSVWVLFIVLYTGEFKTVHYPTKGTCETALMHEIDNGRYKHISVAECTEETK